MIAREVGECRRREGAPRHAFLRERMARDLHGGHSRSGLHHAREQRLQLVGFRRSVRRLRVPARPARLDGAEKTGREARARANLLGEIRRRRLAVGAGDAEKLHPLRRLAVEPGSGERERAPGLRGDDQRRRAGFDRSIAEHRHRAPHNGLRSEGGAVRLRSAERREERARRDLPRVDGEGLHVDPSRLRWHPGIDAREQLPEPHALLSTFLTGPAPA